MLGDAAASVSFELFDLDHTWRVLRVAAGRIKGGRAYAVDVIRLK